MGWPRKNEEIRLYREKRGASGFLMIFPDEPWGPGNYTAIGNVLASPGPSLCGTGVSPAYIADNRLKRLAWSDLPADYQAAYREYMQRDGSIFVPETVRGLWRMGEGPNS